MRYSICLLGVIFLLISDSTSLRIKRESKSSKSLNTAKSFLSNLFSPKNNVTKELSPLLEDSLDDDDTTDLEIQLEDDTDETDLSGLKKSADGGLKKSADGKLKKSGDFKKSLKKQANVKKTLKKQLVKKQAKKMANMMNKLRKQGLLDHMYQGQEELELAENQDFEPLIKDMELTEQEEIQFMHEFVKAEGDLTTDRLQEYRESHEGEVGSGMQFDAMDGNADSENSTMAWNPFMSRGATPKEKPSAFADAEEIRAWQNAYWYTLFKITDGFTRFDAISIWKVWVRVHADPNVQMDLFQKDLFRRTETELEATRTMGKWLQMQIHMIYVASSLIGGLNQDIITILERARRFESYGCYCSPDGIQRPFTGRGPVQDSLDKNCQSRNQCYQCIRMELGDKCDLRAAYNLEWTRQRELQCDLNPVGSCERRLCDCDRRYFNDVKTFMSTYNPDLKNANGFEASQTCFTSRTRNRYDKCCGLASEGKRKPISFDAGHACCREEEIFRHRREQCCAGGQIIASDDTCPS